LTNTDIVDDFKVNSEQGTHRGAQFSESGFAEFHFLPDKAYVVGLIRVDRIMDAQAFNAASSHAPRMWEYDHTTGAYRPALATYPRNLDVADHKDSRIEFRPPVQLPLEEKPMQGFWHLQTEDARQRILAAVEEQCVIVSP